MTIPTRVRQLGYWLREAKLMWLALGVTVAAGIVALRPCTPEYLIRWTGLVLQLGGVLTVAWGLHATRTLFGHPSLITRAGAWLRRFPLLRRERIHGSSAIFQGVSAVSAIGSSTHALSANPTIEQRLEALERNIALIDERISGTEELMHEEFRKAAESLKKEAQTRRAEDQELSKKLEATGTGGIHISAMGALWLFVGVTLSSGSVEIAGWLK